MSTQSTIRSPSYYKFLSPEWAVTQTLAGTIAGLSPWEVLALRLNLLRKHLKPPGKRFGLPGVTWHLLRHSDATMLDSVGTPLGTMQSLLGHSTPEITREIYLHAIPKEQRRAVESVERRVFGPKWTQVQAPAQTLATRVN